MLALYNTLSNRVEPFAPLEEGRVRMYTCGPTVYDYAHIGNYRTFLFADILRRHLRRSGYELRHVMNLTDVDDKTIRNAQVAGVSLRDYTDQFIAAFWDDMGTLRAERPEIIARATDHIPDMVKTIRELEERGFAYRNDGSVYFRIEKFPPYGKLSKIDLSGNRPGARVDQDEYEKADVRDFVLWKAAKPDEPFWESELGPGRPGWHIECSVMATKYLGETFDIHAGGTDLIFPHHENEIAQSEALTGKPFARFWVHSEHLLVDGQKMSKSLGNYYTLRDLLGKGYAPAAIRYLLVSVPHRKQLNFTLDGLEQAARAIERLENFRFRIAETSFPGGSNPALAAQVAAFPEALSKALDDDLNTAQAMGALFELVREANTAIDAGTFFQGDVTGVLGCLGEWNGVFDVLASSDASAGAGLSSEAIERRIEERQEARRKRNFVLADQIRDELVAAGVLIEDTKEGIRWRRK
ncbi:MAG: cysteine--tRNA ligase [Terriglobia bacterium]